jgi:hypothetical protein
MTGSGNSRLWNGTHTYSSGGDFIILINLIKTSGGDVLASTSTFVHLVTPPSPVLGCTDAQATNYNPNATQDDGSCVYPILGCKNPSAINYNSLATQDDGSCVFPPEPVPGCIDPTALNYNPNATINDGSCIYPVLGCTNPNAINYNSSATPGNVEAENCTFPILGCTDAQATNYNPNATQDDGSCTYPPSPVLGCTDAQATNYNPNATQDDGSCTYTSTATTTYTLTYIAGANGTLTGSTAQIVDEGANGTEVTAVADSGYHFVDWNDGSTSASRTELAVSTSSTYTANFAADQQMTDVCPNIEGSQSDVPTGKHLDNSGNCVNNSTGGGSSGGRSSSGSSDGSNSSSSQDDIINLLGLINFLNQEGAVAVVTPANVPEITPEEGGVTPDLEGTATTPEEVSGATSTGNNEFPLAAAVGTANTGIDWTWPLVILVLIVLGLLYYFFIYKKRRQE